MKIWLLQASEPMPVVNKNARLLRMGMIAEEMTKRGHQVIWFSNTFDHYQKKQLFDRDTIVRVKENYDIYLIHGPQYKKNISIRRIINHKLIAVKFRKMAKKMEKPDLIYVSFPTIDYAEEAVKYGKENNVPVIVDVRDLWPDIFEHNLSGITKMLAKPYIKWMDSKTKKIMRDAFAIHSISQAMLDWGLKKGQRVQQKQDRYFYLGYHKKEDLENTEKEVMDESKFNISFFATINNQFNYEIILDLAEKLKQNDKNVMINICGDGPQFETLKQKAQSYENVKLFGWVGKDIIDYILKSSKLGLAPYKNTFDFQMSVSNKFAEYLSYGLPIILTSDGYMKSLLAQNECGISSQNVEEIYQFIRDVKNDEKIYDQMSQNAKKLYEENFVAEKIYQQLANFLENIKEEK